MGTGWYAARGDGVALRAGTALIARGEFSIVIISLAGTAGAGIGPVVTAYVSSWPRQAHCSRAGRATGFAALPGGGSLVGHRPDRPSFR
jgi:Kef-type K+ transport system membrane component KefB